MSAKAFGLVDLLCVLAVVGVAVMVLPGVIHAAGQAGTLDQCAANLAAMGKAIHLYTVANEDHLPPYRSTLRAGQPFAMPMEQPAFTYHLAKVGDLNPISLQQNWRGIGSVCGSGFVENPQVLYCPDQTDPPFTYAAHEDPQYKQIMENRRQVLADAARSHSPPPEFPMPAPRFGSYSADGKLVRSGYLWNCWGRQYPRAVHTPPSREKEEFSPQSQQATELVWDLAFETLASFEAGKPLGMDLAIYPSTAAAHTDHDTVPPRYNVLKADGAIAMFQPGLAYLESLQANWKDESLPGPHSCWAGNPGNLNDWEEAYEFITR